MKINPFENMQDEYSLSEIIELKNNELEIKEKYKNLFGNYIDYDVLLKSINTNIEWHILDIGAFGGDYFCFTEFNDKFYFVDMGYGTCGFCDALLGCGNNLSDLSELRNSIKSDIREFDNLEEFIKWATSRDTIQWWGSNLKEILDYIKTEFRKESK